MEKIVSLRGERLEIAAERQTRQMLVDNIVALLRRRTATLLAGRMVSIEFATEVEAAAFQKMICELPKRPDLNRDPQWVQDYEAKLQSDPGPFATPVRGHFS